MKEGYYWYFGTWYGEDSDWIVVEVIKRGGETFAYVGSDRKPIAAMPGRFVHIDPPKD